MSDTNQQILEALQRLDARMGRLEERLENVEQSVSMVSDLQEKLPIVAEAAGTMVTLAVDQIIEEGGDPTEMALTGVSLAQMAATPDMLVRAERMLERVDLLDKMLDNMTLVELSLKMGGKLVERLEASGADPDQLMDKSADLWGKLLTLAQSTEFDALVESGALEPDTVSVLGKASTALVQTRQADDGLVGMFGVLGKMSDPDIQRAMGFTFGLAKRFGAAIKA